MDFFLSILGYFSKPGGLALIFFFSSKWAVLEIIDLSVLTLLTIYTLACVDLISLIVQREGMRRRRPTGLMGGAWGQGRAEKQGLFRKNCQWLEAEDQLGVLERRGPVSFPCTWGSSPRTAGGWAHFLFLFLPLSPLHEFSSHRLGPKRLVAPW